LLLERSQSGRDIKTLDDSIHVTVGATKINP
jgi:hypothetical protein